MDLSVAIISVVVFGDEVVEMEVVTSGAEKMSNDAMHTHVKREKHGIILDAGEKGIQTLLVYTFPSTLVSICE